mmetsp:Transcript_1921/g.4338  ORF Transcript_1921/g.4338 Transcript_1921/m.4338 type:complete len:308 (-) Transcript_1921:54-977(-)
MQATKPPPHSMATMMPGSPPSKEVLALTKPEKQRLEGVEAKLTPYQDEKLDIYSQHMNDMSLIFSEARNCRGGLAELYAERNREVLGTLAGIRARTDREARRQLDKLKDFAAEFDGGVSKGRRGWRARLQADQNETGARCGGIDGSIDGHFDAIQKEREECQAFTQAEYGPILDKLREHRAFLDRQIAERESHHSDFCTTLKDQFDKLRNKLGKEAQTRAKQCDASRAEAEKSYGELGGNLQNHDAALIQRLNALRAKLEKERQTRIACHDSKVHRTMRFMEDFEAHLKQQASEVTKLDFKALMEED